MKPTFFIFLFFIVNLSSFAQSGGIGIGTTDVDPDALLQVGEGDSDKGVLFPANTSSEISGITTSPKNGLLMYSNDENRFVYSKGGSWMYLNPWDTDDLAGGLSSISTSHPVTISNDLSADDANFDGAVTASSFEGYGTVPIGGIIMWNGATAAIPANFEICDGGEVNGVSIPNLSGKFIVAGSDPGTTGGSNTLTTGEIVYTARQKYASGTAGCSTYRYLYSGTATRACGAHAGEEMTITKVAANSCVSAFGLSESCVADASCPTVLSNPDYYVGNANCRTDASVASVVTSTNNKPAYYVLAFIIRVE